MLIRPAVSGDLPALTRIYNDAILHTTATFDLTPRTEAERRPWLEAHNTGNHPLLVAETDDAVVGYASLSEYRSKEAFAATVELSIYVDEAFRRRGVATALMSAILALAREDARTHAVVSVITGGNEASTRLHRRFGFTFCGTVPEVGYKFGQYLGIDHWLLMV